MQTPFSILTFIMTHFLVKMLPQPSSKKGCLKNVGNVGIFFYKILTILKMWDHWAPCALNILDDDRSDSFNI